MTTLPPDNASTSLAPISRNGRALSTVPSGSTLIMLAEPQSAAAEAYRALAANLQFSSRDFDVQTLGITSAAPGEGKSTTTANLAIALAEGGRRVIVIDADLRRPTLHTLFGLDNREGLSNVLLGGESHLPLQDTIAPGVRLLSSGPPPANPLEALASRELDHVLSQVRAQSDWKRRALPGRSPPEAASGRSSRKTRSRSGAPCACSSRRTPRKTPGSSPLADTRPPRAL